MTTKKLLFIQGYSLPRFWPGADWQVERCWFSLLRGDGCSQIQGQAFAVYTKNVSSREEQRKARFNLVALRAGTSPLTWAQFSIHFIPELLFLLLLMEVWHFTGKSILALIHILANIDKCKWTKPPFSVLNIVTVCSDLLCTI